MKCHDPNTKLTSILKTVHFHPDFVDSPGDFLTCLVSTAYLDDNLKWIWSLSEGHLSGWLPLSEVQFELIKTRGHRGHNTGHK